MFCHSSPRTREGSAARPLRAVLFALTLLVGVAASDAVVADEALSTRARAVLNAYCAPCRDIMSGADVDLAAVARDPNLIRPGNPDGSPAYSELIRRIGTGTPTAGTDDLGALRSWILSLPASAATCASANYPPNVRIEVELARIATAMRKPMSAFRVLSLNHLDLGCATPEQLAAWRDAIGLIVAAVAAKPQAIRLHTFDGDRFLAIDIQDLGWSAEGWRALLGMAPLARHSDEPLVARADLFVARALRGASSVDIDRQTVRTMLAPFATPDSLERSIDILLQIARQHLAPVGLARVAAELGVRSDVLERSMEPVAKVAPDPWLRLAYGTVPRGEIEGNWPLIARSVGLQAPAHADAPIATVSPRSDAPIDIAIYPDRLRYAAGDAMQLTIRSNADCALTIISIDSAGYGTVIFPNDFATDNRVRAHIDLSLPSKGARYRFRLKSKGRERVVALCTRADGAVDGIQHNFERQRFQELGPYAAFLDAALKRAAGSPEEKSENGGAPLVPQSAIWRTGIVIEVK